MGDKVLAPQAGPQTAFSASDADICVFGGEAGGGKSYILDLEAGKWSHVPGYGAIIFRRDSTQLTGPGSIWETAKPIYRAQGARIVESPTLSATWANGANIHFRHLIHEWTVEDHDGKQYAFVGLDEGQYFTEYMIWYLWGRCRSECGVKPYMRITCNPDPDCYLRTLLDWWIDKETGLPIKERDGVIRWAIRFGDNLEWFDTREEGQRRCADLRAANPDDQGIAAIKPISIQFIRSRLADNKALLAKDPDYGARVAMSDADTRAKKLDGNWNSRVAAGSMFNRTWFGIIDKLPDLSQVKQMVRGWDKAAKKPNKEYPDPDWTRGVLLWLLKNGDVIIADIVSLRGPPGEVEMLIKATAELDGHKVTQAFWQDGGAAGVSDVDHTKALLKGLPCRLDFQPETKNKVEYAKPWSAYADPVTGAGKFYLLRATWNGPFLSEAEKFPKPTGEAGKGIHDDQIDAISRAWTLLDRKVLTGAEKLRKAMQNMG